MRFHAACSELRNPSTSDFNCSDCEDSPFAASSSGAVAPLASSEARLTLTMLLLTSLDRSSALLQIAGNFSASLRPVDRPQLRSRRRKIHPLPRETARVLGVTSQTEEIAML